MKPFKNANADLLSVGLQTLLHERYQRRLGNFALIFETCGEVSFIVPDVADVLKISVSSARAYVNELVEFGLVTIANPVRTKNNVALEYLLTESQEDIDAFMAMMEENAPALPTIAPKRKKRVGKKFDSLLGDEIRQPVKVEVFRHWMDICLFGDGPAPSLAIA